MLQSPHRGIWPEHQERLATTPQDPGEGLAGTFEFAQSASAIRPVRVFVEPRMAGWLFENGRRLRRPVRLSERLELDAKGCLGSVPSQSKQNRRCRWCRQSQTNLEQDRGRVTLEFFGATVAPTLLRAASPCHRVEFPRTSPKRLRPRRVAKRFERAPSL